MFTLIHQEWKGFCVRLMTFNVENNVDSLQDYIEILRNILARFFKQILQGPLNTFVCCENIPGFQHCITAREVGNKTTRFPHE